MQGRQYMNLVKLKPAIELFEQAVILDPDFADPYAAMARGHNLYVVSVRRHGMIRRKSSNQIWRGHLPSSLT